MEEGMATSAPTQGAFGMRIFDAAEFHIGFGIVAPSDNETTELSIQGITSAATTGTECARRKTSRIMPLKSAALLSRSALS
jgi:hypothetical protein